MYCVCIINKLHYTQMTMLSLVELWAEEETPETDDGVPLQEVSLTVLCAGVSHRAAQGAPGTGGILGVCVRRWVYSERGGRHLKMLHCLSICESFVSAVKYQSIDMLLWLKLNHNWVRIKGFLDILSISNKFQSHFK